MTHSTCTPKHKKSNHFVAHGASKSCKKNAGGPIADSTSTNKMQNANFESRKQTRNWSATSARGARAKSGAHRCAWSANPAVALPFLLACVCVCECAFILAWCVEIMCRLIGGPITHSTNTTKHAIRRLLIYFVYQNHAKNVWWTHGPFDLYNKTCNPKTVVIQCVSKSCKNKR